MKEETHKKREFESKSVMTCELTLEFFKMKVGHLRRYLRKRGYEVKLPELYDAAALLHGYKNWQTMRAIGFEIRPEEKKD